MTVSYTRASTMDTVHALGAEIATWTSDSYDLDAYTELLVFLRVTAASGPPTFDLKVQSSPNLQTWFDVSGHAFAQITGVFTPNALKITNFGRYVRFVGTIGGSTPSVTFALDFTAKS